MSGDCASLILFGLAILWLLVVGMRFLSDEPADTKERKLWSYIPPAILASPFMIKLFLAVLFS